MTQEEIRHLIENDDDFINIKRFDYSLKKLLERYEGGAPSRVISQALQMTEEEVEQMYQTLLLKLRTKLDK